MKKEEEEDSVSYSGIPKQQGCETLINSITTVGLRITVFNRMHCNIKTTQVFYHEHYDKY